MIVGHRGAGKTSLLARWRSYCPHLSFADLDQEIELSQACPITRIFSEKGEDFFREVERKIWKSLEEKSVVSVGGGFDLDCISTDWKILWARRDSDSPDRIFLDRPPLPDYKRRFEERERRFNQKANIIYTIPEGLFQPDEEERRILLGAFENVGGAITLPRRFYPGALIEVRDDLGTRGTCSPMGSDPTNLLFSVRKGNQYPSDVKVDWDIKRPVPAGLSPYIISTHEQSLSDLLPYEASGAILKFCPEVTRWDDLLTGLNWQKENPERHVFLPRSKSGKWTWFRLWMKGRQPLNFWREGKGSSCDQPTLWEWLGHPNRTQNFAAVLGSPVQHSYSPAYHKSFFLKFGFPFYRVQIERTEWPQAIKVLDQLGLVAAAVTSPLKLEAGQWVGGTALNTLWKQGETWKGATTDQIGAEALLKDFTGKTAVVWGGGGVLGVLKEVLPKAAFYSSQEGLPREHSYEIEDPEILIWGDPHDSTDRVPHSWHPEVILDLSYHDRSPARHYAQKIKARYVSGVEMFTSQAHAQQALWERVLSERKSIAPDQRI